MKLLLLQFFIFVGSIDLLSQDSTFVTIKAGYKVTDVLTPSDIYQYPQFTNGKVFFMDGSKAGAKLNYNRLYGQMLFVGTNGDTLALADEKTIKFIAVDRDTFYFNEGFLRLIAFDGAVRLAEKQIWVVADVRKMGTHNRNTNTVAITSFSTYSDGNEVKGRDLILNEDIILKKETQYYIGDKYNLFVRANKKGFLLIFGNDEQRIESYLKENKVSFEKKDDIEKLILFLRQ